MARLITRRPPAPTVPARVQQLELFALPALESHDPGMRVPAWRGLAAWHAELDRQRAIMRPRTPLYHRFDATARQLTVERIRASRDLVAIQRLETRLGAARYPSADLHGLDRVWSRAELGTLLVEARNRRILLDLGRDVPRSKGPALDPARLPDDRLAHLIQTHRDLSVVEALRAERQRRASETNLIV